MRAGGKRWLLSGPRSSFGAAGFPWSDLLQLVFYFVCPRGLALTPPCGLVLALCAPVAVGVSAPALSPSGWCPHVEGGCLQSHRVTDSGGGGSGETARLDHSAHPLPPSLRACQASVLFG